METESKTIREIKEENGILIGPVRKPFNEHLHSETSIHHDGTAQKLGMRGGTIAGSYHMEQFTPLFLKTFGRKWFESGGLSMYFRNATTHLEPVQCFMHRPESLDNTQTDVWMKDENDLMVGEGTVSIGIPDEPSVLRKRVANPYPPGNLRILADLKKGMEIPPLTVNASSEQNRDRLPRMTEPLGWYAEKSPWGGPIMTAPQVTHALRLAMNAYHEKTRKDVVGLFGALEFRYIKGPLFCDKDYVNKCKILLVGETPKTEYYWLEGILEDPERGEKIADGLVMIRIMKASSTQYPELK